MKDNYIVIDGVKHTLVRDDPNSDEVCKKCSLLDRCHEGGLCWRFFETENCHFEILKQEQNKAKGSDIIQMIPPDEEFPYSYEEVKGGKDLVVRIPFIRTKAK